MSNRVKLNIPSSLMLTQRARHPRSSERHVWGLVNLSKLFRQQMNNFSAILYFVQRCFPPNVRSLLQLQFVDVHPTTVQCPFPPLSLLVRSEQCRAGARTRTKQASLNLQSVLKYYLWQLLIFSFFIFIITYYFIVILFYFFFYSLGIITV